MSLSKKNPVPVEPLLAWLRARWGLSDHGLLKTAGELLTAEHAQGSTALRLPEGHDDFCRWGDAAAGDPGDFTAPLVIVESEGTHYLQTRRCHEAERSVAGHITRFCSDDPVQVGEDLITGLFPGATMDDPQVTAANTALRSRLCVITGGPGTGKTWTLARILTLFLKEGAVLGEKIALAAPTGKAADRMRDAIKAAASDLEGEIGEILVKVASRSCTLHKLMGFNPATGECRHGPDNPLPWKLLILDECSMIDLHLWKVFLESLPDDARIILLGDPKQLQSVGQGCVFGDLSSHSEHLDSPLHGRRVHLTGTRRFGDCPGIKALADAMQEDDPGAAEEVLTSSTTGDSDLVWIETGERHPTFESFPETFKQSLKAIAAETLPEEALRLLGTACILTPHRSSVIGAESLSRGISRSIAAIMPPGNDRVPNEPIIINRNDPETGLRNGAVGIVLTDPEGRRRAYFPHGQGCKAYSLGTLPDHSPAWAITIHRSQGSEYDQVLVILPHKESVMATRELLYTAITRARKRVIVAGDMEAVRKAVASPVQRDTLLKEALDRIN